MAGTTIIYPTSPPKPTAVADLGITRSKIQRLYESPEIGFVFDEVVLPDGTPRASGRSPDGLVLLVLTGPLDRLESVSITIGVHRDRLLLRLAYAIGLLENVIPDWVGAATWFNDAVEESVVGDPVQTVVRRGKRVTLTNDASRLVHLDIEVAR